MKLKSFKTKSNNGTICKVEVIVIDSEEIIDGLEDAVIIQTKRVIPKSEFESYKKLNDKFPMYFAIKESQNFAYVITRSAPVRLSTFFEIYKTINELIWK